MSSARRRVSDRALVLCLLLPLGTAGAYGVALFIRFAGITTALTWDPDLVSPMVIGDSLGSRPASSDVVLGTYGPFTTLWLNLLTKPFPSHHVIWKAWPYLLSLCGIGLLVWASRRVGSRWAALVTGAMAFAAATPVFLTFAAQANHGTTYFMVCVFGAFLVLVTTTEGKVGALVVGAVVVGLLAGTNAASDPLLLLVGLAPFAGAMAFVFLRDAIRPKPATLAVGLVTVVTTGVSMLVTLMVMTARGYKTLGVDPAPASPNDAPDAARQLARDLLRVTNGNFVDRDGAEVLASLVLAAAAAFVCGFFLTRAARAVGRMATSRTQRQAPDPKAFYVVYWALGAGLLGTSYFVTAHAQSVGGQSIRYMTPIFLAIAVTVPLLLATTRPRQVAVALTVTLFCVMSTLSLVRVPTRALTVAMTELDPLLSLLESKGLRRGYAGYMNAAPLTFNNNAGIEVYPVMVCGDSQGRLSLCGFPANRISSWYEARPDTRTFVITDPEPPGEAGTPFVFFFTLPAAAPEALGSPSEVHKVGSLLVFVYAYDVASRFGPTL